MNYASDVQRNMDGHVPAGTGGHVVCEELCKRVNHESALKSAFCGVSLNKRET